MSAATINPNEAAHFGALAADWWDPHGSSAMLHKLNPVRLAYIRAQIDAHWHVDARERYALAGRSAIDVGCGAGLLAEPLARMGAKVTGVDAAPENIAAAQGHAAGQGLSIDYFAGELADLERLTPFVSSEVETPGRRARSMGISTSLDANGDGKAQQFDLVTSMEVVEHVTDPAAFIGELVYPEHEWPLRHPAGRKSVCRNDPLLRHHLQINALGRVLLAIGAAHDHC